MYLKKSIILIFNFICFKICKIQGAESIKDYRPIVVANFKFKIISKILADRLALVAARILISMGLCRADRFKIVLVLLLKLLTCFLKRFTEAMWLTKLIFTKLLTL